MSDAAHSSADSPTAAPPDDVGAAVAEVERRRTALARSLAALRGDAAHLGDGLRARVSPSAIRARAQNAAVRAGGEARDDVMRTARRQPVAMAMLAAGLAVPIYKLVRKLPPSLALAAAGLGLLMRGGDDDGADRRTIQSNARTGRAVPPSAATRRAPPARAASRMRAETTRRVPVERRLPPPSKTASSLVRARPKQNAGRRPGRADAGPVEKTVEAARRHPLATGLLGITAALTLAAVSSPAARGETRRMGRRVGRTVSKEARALRDAVPTPDRSTRRSGTDKGAGSRLRGSAKPMDGAPTGKVSTPSTTRAAPTPVSAAADGGASTPARASAPKTSDAAANGGPKRASAQASMPKKTQSKANARKRTANQTADKTTARKRAAETRAGAKRGSTAPARTARGRSRPEDKASGKGSGVGGNGKPDGT